MSVKQIRKSDHELIELYNNIYETGRIWFVLGDLISAEYFWDITDETTKEQYQKLVDKYENNIAQLKNIVKVILYCERIPCIDRTKIEKKAIEGQILLRKELENIKNDWLNIKNKRLLKEKNMSNKVRRYHVTRDVYDSKLNQKHTILIYGELTQSNYEKGFLLAPITFNKKNHNDIKKIDDRYVVLNRVNDLRPVRSFNFGWAICDENDEFNLEFGIRTAKRRFSDSPMTTTDVRFFSNDMIASILENELDFIEQHLEEKYLPQEKDEDESEKDIFDSDLVFYDGGEPAEEGSDDVKTEESNSFTVDHTLGVSCADSCTGKHNCSEENKPCNCEKEDCGAKPIKSLSEDEQIERIAKKVVDILTESGVEFDVERNDTHSEKNGIHHLVDGDFVVFNEDGSEKSYGVIKSCNTDNNTAEFYWIFRVQEDVYGHHYSFETNRTYENFHTYKIGTDTEFVNTNDKLEKVFGYRWDTVDKHLRYV